MNQNMSITVLTACFRLISEISNRVVSNQEIKAYTPDPSNYKDDITIKTNMIVNHMVNKLKV